MKLREFKYFSPRDLSSALELLAIHGRHASLLAGGTDLLVRMKQRLLAPDIIINLKDIKELRGVQKMADGSVFIGALTQLTELITSSLIQKKYRGLWEAVKTVSAPPLRNMGTVGGNVAQQTRCLFYNQTEMWRQSRPVCFKAGGTQCNAVKGGKHCFAVYQGDLAPVLIALSAQVTLSGKDDTRTIPLKELYSGKGKQPLTLEDNEIIEGIVLPPPDKNRRCAYKKLRLREAIDYPLVGVAACVTLAADGKTCEAGKVVLTAVGSGPVVISPAKLFKGVPMDDDWVNTLAEEAYKASKPVANVTTPPTYRKRMARVLTRRALNAVRAA